MPSPAVLRELWPYHCSYQFSVHRTRCPIQRITGPTGHFPLTKCSLVYVATGIRLHASELVVQIAFFFL